MRTTPARAFTYRRLIARARTAAILPDAKHANIGVSVDRSMYPKGLEMQ